LLASLGLALASCVWLGLRGLVTGTSGWRSLAGSFHVENVPDGERFRFAAGSIGGGLISAHYKNILNVVVSPSGFGISLVSVWGRPPAVFIPWTEVQSVAKSRSLFVETAEIRVRGQRSTICLYRNAGASVVHAYTSLPKPTP
jgi:hypothetical protein